MKSIEKLPKLGPVEVTLTAEQARLAVLASECASEDPTRAYMNSVYVQVVDGEFQACATDGYRAVVLTCPAGDLSVRGHVTPSALALLKTVPRKVPPGYHVPTVRLEPSDFPDLAPLLAKTERAQESVWHGNPNLLAPLAAFCNFYAAKKDKSRVTILPGGGDAPLRCEVSAAGEVVGLMVVMPCRRVMP